MVNDIKTVNSKSLILSIFTYAIEVWGCASYNIYLSHIDTFFDKAFKFGYTKERYSISSILAKKAGSETVEKK
jgi:hypothetical protein